jgi:stress-induced morphogen
MLRAGRLFSLRLSLNVKALEATLMQDDKLRPQWCQVEDISGGCGSFIKVTVESHVFDGMNTLQQHRLVNQALREEIPKLHGLTIDTKVPKKGSEFHRPESK